MSSRAESWHLEREEATEGDERAVKSTWEVSKKAWSVVEPACVKPITAHVKQGDFVSQLFETSAVSLISFHEFFQDKASNTPGPCAGSSRRHPKARRGSTRQRVEEKGGSAKHLLSLTDESSSSPSSGERGSGQEPPGRQGHPLWRRWCVLSYTPPQHMSKP